MREKIREHALALGFSAVGFCKADPPLPGLEEFTSWLAQGRHGSMRYLADRPARRADPRALLAAARTLVVAAARYPAGENAAPVAAYARTADYHRVLAAALDRLLAHVQELAPGTEGVVAVDTRPLFERAAAARAGLGWIGKNTMLLDRRHGPWLMLGVLVLSIDLPADTPEPDRCGTCRACLDACPTGALFEPRRLDATRCISYWTIEHRGPLPDELKEAAGERVFGCDDCLLACPYGGADRADGPLLALAPELQDLTPAVLLERLEQGFNRHFKHHALGRAGKAGLTRNALTALGNSAADAPGGGTAFPADLVALLERHAASADAGVAEHARWAQERLAGRRGAPQDGPPRGPSGDADRRNPEGRLPNPLRPGR